MNTILKVKELKKQDILNGISFDVSEGEMIAVMGPSGSGKSTLLYNVSGMDRADGGQVWLGDRELVCLSEEEKAKIRLNRMGFVFQRMNMLSNLNIIDNITFPAVKADRKHKAEYYKRAQKLLDDFHIGEIANRRIKEVSGGQLQRACICRSMILDPEIIFADEPTGALNRTSAKEVMDAFLKINRQDSTILMVTHDSMIASMCDRIIYLLDGEIRGELTLGKYRAENGKEREQELAKWLEEFGW